MTFRVCNKQTLVPIDEAFWDRAFNYASRELQIDCHHAEVVCLFIPLVLERKIKFKHFSLGATGLTETGAMFYVVTAAANLDVPAGYMVKTFFHEMTHVKQMLMGDLIEKARTFVWKGEKWNKREYAFAPWEIEANTFSERLYERFLRREVTRRMQDENVNAYHTSILELRSLFAEEDVFRLTRELHRERDRERDALASSPRDGLMMAS